MGKSIAFLLITAGIVTIAAMFGIIVYTLHKEERPGRRKRIVVGVGLLVGLCVTICGVSYWIHLDNEEFIEAIHRQNMERSRYERAIRTLVEESVKQRLERPSTATFEIGEGSRYEERNGQVILTGYVSSLNGSGARIKTKYVVTIRREGYAVKLDDIETYENMEKH